MARNRSSSGSMIMELNAIAVASFCLVVSAYPGRAVASTSYRATLLISRKKLRRSAPSELMFPLFTGHGAPQNLRFAWHHIGLKWAGRACPFHHFCLRHAWTRHLARRAINSPSAHRRDPPACVVPKPLQRIELPGLGGDTWTTTQP